MLWRMNAEIDNTNVGIEIINPAVSNMNMVLGIMERSCGNIVRRSKAYIRKYESPQRADMK